jgi:hypothetical protein
MKTEIEFKAFDFWNNLSVEDRTKILKEYNFWLGFSNNLYPYIPEELQTIIMLKIEANEQFGV